MSALDNERFYPASPDLVFAALQASLPRLRWRIKRMDKYSRVASFATPMGGFSWGASVSAQVIPDREGATLRVGGRAKMRANITAKGAEYKNVLRLLDDVSVILQYWQEQERASGA